MGLPPVAGARRGRLRLPGLPAALGRRQAAGLVAALVLLGAGRTVRQALLVGPDGQWRRELWLDGVLDPALAGDAGADAPGAVHGHAPGDADAADDAPPAGAADSAAATTPAAGSGPTTPAGSAPSSRRTRVAKGPPVPLDPNRAPPDSLQLLPGVGPVMAGRIVAAREQGTVFRKPEDLLAIKGIGPATLARLAPFLRFPGAGKGTPAAGAGADNGH